MALPVMLGASHRKCHCGRIPSLLPNEASLGFAIKIQSLLHCHFSLQLTGMVWYVQPLPYAGFSTVHGYLMFTYEGTFATVVVLVWVTVGAHWYTKFSV